MGNACGIMHARSLHSRLRRRLLDDGFRKMSGLLGYLIGSLVDSRAVDPMQETLINVAAGEQVLFTVGREHRNVVQHNVAARRLAAADYVAALGRVLRARLSVHILYQDIRDREAGRELVAQREILLPIA